jgi:hypothetical protein
MSSSTNDRAHVLLRRALILIECQVVETLAVRLLIKDIKEELEKQK